jgi:hypothetical protein
MVHHVLHSQVLKSTSYYYHFNTFGCWMVDVFFQSLGLVPYLAQEDPIDALLVRAVPDAPAG